MAPLLCVPMSAIDAKIVTSRAAMASTLNEAGFSGDLARLAHHEAGPNGGLSALRSAHASEICMWQCSQSVRSWAPRRPSAAHSPASGCGLLLIELLKPPSHAVTRVSAIAARGERQSSITLLLC